MKSLLRLLPLLLFALPAFADGGPATYAMWQALHNPDAGAVSFSDAYGFLRDHPGWPQEGQLRQRAEQAALQEHPPRDVMQKFCTDLPPISGRGMIACAEAGIGDAAQRADWIKQGWLQGDFSASEEEAILARHHFTSAENEDRLDRMLYAGKSAAAKRMLPHVPPAIRLPAEARIALINDARNAPAKIFGVPKAYKNHPGLLFNRMQWRAQHHQDDGVLEMLLAAPNDPPYADYWWPYRASAVRDALEEKRYNDAMLLLAHKGKLNAENDADALFLNGWATMEFKHDPRHGYEDFYKLYGNVATPVSKSRAAYWAGRAAQKNGNPDIAKGWFGKAAEFPTTYYGQLAAYELSPGSALDLPDAPDAGHVVDDEQVKTALWLAAQDDTETADLFFANLADHSDAPQVAALAERAQRNHYTHAAVKVAKQALRKHTLLVEAGWPLVEVPKQSAIEPGLTLAIARQESEFNPKARSRADARGLMQLLPATAKHTAKHDGLDVDARDLYDPETNLIIGSHYLGGLVDGWDGSYILAIASYNAGPANVRQWVARFGPPPRNLEGAIDWVEKIPFAETRNYVQRVLENLQVYRARLQPETPLGITGDLLR